MMATKEEIDDAAFLIARMWDGLEYYLVVSGPPFAFRFGPYTAEEAQRHLAEANRQKVAVTIVGDMGREFDWDLSQICMGLKRGRRKVLETPE